MKPPHASSPATTAARRRRHLLILLCFLLAAIISVCLFLKQRADALAVAESQINSGLRVEWEYDGKISDEIPTGLLDRFSPFTQPVKVTFDDHYLNTAEAATALSNFDGIRELVIGQGQPEHALTILQKLLPQHPIESLQLLNVPLDARMLPLLGQCPTLKSVCVVPCHFSGESFPILPELITLDIRHSHSISDPGLEKILSCPKLEHLQLEGAKLTKDGVLRAIAKAPATLHDLTIGAASLSRMEIEQITSEAHKKLPRLHVNIYRKL